MGWYEIKGGHRSSNSDESSLKEKVKEVKRLMGDICEEIDEMEDRYRPVGYRTTDKAWRIEEDDERYKQERWR